MTYRNILATLLLFLGYSLCWVRGQDDVRNVVRTNQDQHGNSEESAEYRLQNVSSYDDFLSLLRTEDGNPVRYDQIISNYTDESGRILINSGGGRMAQPDDCSPRDTTIRLTFDNSDPNAVYFPRCTKIERCGGCCATNNLECVPSYTERVSYKVAKAHMPYPGSTHLEWKGDYATVILERHVNCRVQCTLTADKCGPKRNFMERACQCQCKVYERCQPPRIWDPEACECKCAEVIDCCKDTENCVMTFLRETCECGIKQVISNNGTQQQIDAYFASLNSINNGTSDETESTTASSTQIDLLMPSLLLQSDPASSSSTTVTTEEMTTTSTMTTEADPCPNIICPLPFHKTRNPNGTCICSRPRRNRNPTLH